MIKGSKMNWPKTLKMVIWERLLSFQEVFSLSLFLFFSLFFEWNGPFIHTLLSFPFSLFSFPPFLFFSFLFFSFLFFSFLFFYLNSGTKRTQFLFDKEKESIKEKLLSFLLSSFFFSFFLSSILRFSSPP